MKTLTALALFAGLFVVAGCGETATDTPTADAPAADSGGETVVVAAVNEVCPIMEKAVTDNGGRTEYEGQTVGFCCPGCIKKWDALSADEKKTKLASSMKADAKGAAMGTNGTQFVSLTKSSESCCSGSKTAGKAAACCSESGAKASCCASSTAKTSSSCCSGATTVAATSEFVCPMKCTTAVKDGGKCKVCSMELVEKPVAATTVAFNTNCPIMGSPVKAGGGSAEWNGKTVGFCCPGCVKKWDALSGDEKAQKLTDTNPADEKAGA